MSVMYTKETVGPGLLIRQVGWRNKRPPGGSYPNSAYNYTKSEYNEYKSYCVGHPMDHPLYNKAYNLAYKRFYEQVRTKVDAMANLAELPSTIGTVERCLTSVCDAALNIGKGIYAAKHGDSRGAKRAFRKAKQAVGVNDLKRFNDTFAGAVLAVNWGIRPVVQDVTKTLNGVLSRNNSGAVVKAKETLQDRYTVTYGDNVNKAVVTTSVTVSLQGTVVVERPYLASAANSGLTNPLATAWELVPFSFVVDWFCNVGDIISSLSNDHGIIIDRASLVGISRYQTSMSKYVEGQIVGSTSRDFKLFRTNVAGFPGPTLSFDSPFGGPQRLLNQTALLVTLFSHWRT